MLFLLPFGPDLRGTHGGSRATAAIIDMLSKDHSVRVLYLAPDDASAPRQLPDGCEDIAAVPLDQPAIANRSRVGRFADAITRAMWRPPEWVEATWSPLMASRAADVVAKFRPDVVHCEFHVMAQYIPFVRAARPLVRCVVTEHEPGITADERGGGFPTMRQRFGGLARRLAWQRFERRALRLADAILAFTVSDATALAHLLGPTHPPITVIPLRLPADALSSSPKAAPVKSDFLFVGNFRHPPNVDAAQRLVSDIFPLILRELPDSTLTIVGADPPEGLAAAASDRVKVTGSVDDPSIYLAGAGVVLVPLRQGGGLRVKMLEACAAGKAIVASPMSVEGLALTDRKEVMLAETDEEFAAIALMLMADAAMRAQLEAASKRWSESEQDERRWAAQYADFYAELLRHKGREDVRPLAGKSP